MILHVTGIQLSTLPERRPCTGECLASNTDHHDLVFNSEHISSGTGAQYKD